MSGKQFVKRIEQLGPISPVQGPSQVLCGASSGLPDGSLHQMHQLTLQKSRDTLFPATLDGGSESKKASVSAHHESCACGRCGFILV